MFEAIELMRLMYSMVSVGLMPPYVVRNIFLDYEGKIW